MDQYFGSLSLPLSQLFHRDVAKRSKDSSSCAVEERQREGESSTQEDSRRSGASVADSETDEDSSENEMDLIGRLPFFSNPVFNSQTLGNLGIDRYHWLVTRYLAPFGGEPTGIMAAEEPETYPPIEHVEMSNSTSAAVSTMHSIRRRRRRRRRRRTHNQREVLSAGIGVTETTSTTTTALSPRETCISGEPYMSSEITDEKELRRRIAEIKTLSLTDRERDVRVQKLLTENYYKQLEEKYGKDDSSSGEEGQIVDDVEEEADDDDDDEYEEIEEIQIGLDTIRMSMADKEPTYTQDGELGCRHYIRGCKKECSTCKKWYTCRLCHDEKEKHSLIRPDTKHMYCMHCKTPQKVGQECANCGVVLARYYCPICHLWDDSSTNIYHCNDCGICRIGEGLGKDFFHCKKCQVCMAIELKDAHRCIEHATECDCPVCGEYMFTSTETVVFMKCWHSIHQSCFTELTKTSYKCPTCSRSIINMEASFRILDAEIEAQILPEPYCNWRSIITCNDCAARSNVPFHFLGLKCSTCKSYNTAQHKLIKPEEEGEDLATDISRRLSSSLEQSDLPSTTGDESDSNDGDVVHWAR